MDYLVVVRLHGPFDREHDKTPTTQENATPDMTEFSVDDSSEKAEI